jgi:hypothetical protein
MKRPTEQQMLAAIAAQPRITLSELCQQLDMTHRAVDEALLDLSRRRLVNRLPGWVLTPDGHAALEPEPEPDPVAEEPAPVDGPIVNRYASIICCPWPVITNSLLADTASVPVADRQNASRHQKHAPG